MKTQATAHSLYALYETLPQEVQQAFLAELLHHKQQELLHLIATQSVNRQANITQGDKSIDPTALFGIWQDSPRNLMTLRTQAWQRSNDGFM